MNGNILMPLNVNNEDTIETVKQKIQQQMDIPIDQMSLVFSDQELENNGIISEYGILNNDLLELYVAANSAKSNVFNHGNIGKNIKGDGLDIIKALCAVTAVLIVLIAIMIIILLCYYIKTKCST